jgi:hypothetical protein
LNVVLSRACTTIGTIVKDPKLSKAFVKVKDTLIAFALVKIVLKNRVLTLTPPEITVSPRIETLKDVEISGGESEVIVNVRGVPMHKSLVTSVALAKGN